MDFKDTIQQIVEKIAKQKDSIATEEATKTSFVMPVIAAYVFLIVNTTEVNSLSFSPTSCLLFYPYF